MAPSPLTRNDGGTLTRRLPRPARVLWGASGNKTGQFLANGFPQFGAGGAVVYLWEWKRR